MTEWIGYAVGQWQAGGPLLAPIAFVNAGLWGFFLRSRALLARTLRDGRPVERALARADAGHGTLLTAVEQHAGGIAAMVRAALRDIGLGARPLEAFEAREAECLRALARDFVLVAALTAVAPLLGLMGTVMGMIETFEAVADTVGATGERVATGISRALITTQFGLVVALPGLFGLARLRRLRDQARVLMAQCRAHAVVVLESPSGETPP